MVKWSTLSKLYTERRRDQERRAVLVCTPPEMAAPGLRLRAQVASASLDGLKRTTGSRHRGVAGCFRWTARDNRLRGRMRQPRNIGRTSQPSGIDRCFRESAVFLVVITIACGPSGGPNGPAVAHAQGPKTASRSAQFEAVVEKNVMIPMRDGVSLAADIYRPGRDGKPSPGRFPALLIAHSLQQGRRPRRRPLLRRARLRGGRQRRARPLCQRGHVATDRR